MQSVYSVLKEGGEEGKPSMLGAMADVLRFRFGYMIWRRNGKREIFTGPGYSGIP
jgi:hypothetical protein